ncbi:LacI family DNA-binding transcriptional regulator [Paenibacillus guangzhouensis]|uniref:LacI family DNA-binding transcriptional regulator n=1 Tax=Paenibacillus guangzhouensis TaxID=1473112 RepID=UPI001267411C|nr:LacI family DNA-binding transcriptional regulator [Paenibacillus guangzhouensis]
MQKITSKHIAEICGVTRGTVDRALNNRPGIKPATREKILKAAEELGYRPDYLGQSLVRGETRTLGIVMFDVHNRIFAQLFHAFEEVARSHGYFVYLVLSHKDQAVEIEYIHNLIDRRVDGIALNPINEGAAFESLLQKTRTPILTFGNELSAHFPHIWIDDQAAIQDAVNHIAVKGYQHILYVSPPLRFKGRENIHVPEQRYAGLQSALQQHPDISHTVITSKDYVDAIHAELQKSFRRTAILCTSDIFALEVLKSLKDAGMDVPHEVGVMGFDNIDMLNYIDPPLTTVDYQVEDIGRRLADSLIRRIQGEVVPSRTIVTHSIMERSSL